MSDDQPVVRVTDALGHDLPAMSADLARQMLEWLDLEALVGELPPGLAGLRDRLRREVDPA